MTRGFLLATLVAFVVLLYSPCTKDTGSADPEHGHELVFSNLRLYMTRDLGTLTWSSLVEERRSLGETWQLLHGIVLLASKEILFVAGIVGLSQLPLLSAGSIHLRPAFRWGAVFIFAACAIAAGAEAFELPRENFGPFNEGQVQPRFGTYLYPVVYVLAAVTIWLRVSTREANSLRNR